MEGVSWGKKRFVKKWAAMVLLLIGLFTSPISAFASTVLPSQVLPPATGKACAPVTFSDIQTHVYNTNLDSFDITISDKSYVAVSTSVNNTPVGFNYISRWNSPNGSVKMHVDLQSIRLDKDIPVQITFLSTHSDAGGSLVTCVFNVPAKIVAVTTGGVHPIPGQTPPIHVPRPNPKPTTGGGTGATSSGTTSAATSTYNPGIVAAMNSLGNLCADGGATRLWVVLLVLFALFCFTLCAQKFEVGSSVRDWSIGLILAVFVGLLIFWYVSAACRTGAWAPALATLITIVGLLYTMLKSDDPQEILLLKDSKK
jgi:hypothetical protein